MVYQNNYNAFLIFALIVLGGAILLGGMINEKITYTLGWIPTKTLQSEAAVGVLSSSSRFVENQPVPTRTPTLVSIQEIVQATLIYPTVVAGQLRATVEAVQAQATLTVLAAQQLEASVQQTRIAEQVIVEKTRTAQQAADLSTKRIAEIKREDEKQENENFQTALINVLLVTVTIGLVFCLVIITVTYIRLNVEERECRIRGIKAKEKEAEAKVLVEQRRLLQVQAAVHETQERKVFPNLAEQSHAHSSNNGHGSQTDTVNVNKN